MNVLVVLKPDLVVNSEAVAEVLCALAAQGYVLHAVRVLNPMTRQEAEALYVEHHGRDYYERNIEFMTGGVSIAIWMRCNFEYEAALRYLRLLIGATDPKAAAPNTMRHKYGSTLPRNAIHASATAADAEREISIFFWRK